MGFFESKLKPQIMVDYYVILTVHPLKCQNRLKRWL